ncbi:aminopeptidase P family protein [Candidatus Bathyarchaeota archaeon]|nr:aminopeptidase P family protein [Candidatus Bathyarchaeota archaeon]
MDAKLTALSKRRIEVIKDQLRNQKIDAALIMGAGMGNSILERLSGSRSGAVLVIPAEGDPGLVVMPIDYTYASDHAWVKVFPVSEESSRKRDSSPHVEEVLTSVKIKKKPKIGTVISALNPTLQDWAKNKMKAELIEIKDTILDPLFIALDPVEWPYQKKISEIVDIGQKAAYEAIQPGVTTNEVAASITAAELKAGASGVGYLQVSTGKRSAYSHDSAENIKIKKGDLVLVDLCPTANGYGSDETRTYLAGSGSAKAKKMINAVNKSVEAVLTAIRLGGTGGELDDISRKVLAAEDYPSYPHTLGHPLSGCNQPSLRPGSKNLLVEGSIFTVEPGIYELGYGGVRIEENVLVKKDGFEVLTKWPRVHL